MVINEIVMRGLIIFRGELNESGMSKSDRVLQPQRTSYITQQRKTPSHAQAFEDTRISLDAWIVIFVFLIIIVLL